MLVDKAGLLLAALLITFWVVPKLYVSTKNNPPHTRADFVMIFSAWTAIWAALVMCAWGIIK
jgi:hypothetical protein